MDWWYLTAFALLASWAIAFGLGWFVRRGQGPREDDTQRVTFEQLKSMPLPDFGPHELREPQRVADDWQRIVTGGKS